LKLNSTNTYFLIMQRETSQSKESYGDGCGAIEVPSYLTLRSLANKQELNRPSFHSLG
jgi:hypothetical protein